MFPRILNPLVSNSFFLFGARGTGKTSLLRHLFQETSHLWINLLESKEERRYAKNPDLLSEVLKAAKPKPEWIIIDEVQKVPKLLDIVHKEIEESGVKFALTGSSARKLKRGGANLLAGRAFVFHLFPLTFTEIGEKFSLEEILRWGSLPKILNYSTFQEKELFLEAYIDTYLREEILQEQVIRNVQPFRRFLEVAAQSCGTIINFSKIAADIGVDSKTVKSYFEVLEDTLLGFSLPAYQRSIRKQQLLAPKFYLFDCGIKHGLCGTLGNFTFTSQEFGVAFEHFLIGEIYRLNRYGRSKYQMFYLATKGGAEVDLILERTQSAPIFIEIKATEEVTERHLSHLSGFKKDNPHIRALCLSNDPFPRVQHNIEILPWKEGLKELGLYK